MSRIIVYDIYEEDGRTEIGLYDIDTGEYSKVTKRAVIVGLEKGLTIGNAQLNYGLKANGLSCTTGSWKKYKGQRWYDGNIVVVNNYNNTYGVVRKVGYQIQSKIVGKKEVEEYLADGIVSNVDSKGNLKVIYKNDLTLKSIDEQRKREMALGVDDGNEYKIEFGRKVLVSFSDETASLSIDKRISGIDIIGGRSLLLSKKIKNLSISNCDCIVKNGIRTNIENLLINTNILSPKILSGSIIQHNIIGSEKLEQLGAECLYNSNIMTKLNLSNVTYIAESALRGSTITELITGNKLKVVEDSGFDGSKGEFTIDSDLFYIGSCAFKNSGLTHFRSRTPIMHMGYKPFIGCENLVYVDLSAGISPIAYPRDGKIDWFKDCNNLKKVILPDQLKKYIIMGVDNKIVEYK